MTEESTASVAEDDDSLDPVVHAAQDERPNRVDGRRATNVPDDIGATLIRVEMVGWEASLHAREDSQSGRRGGLLPATLIGGHRPLRSDRSDPG